MTQWAVTVAKSGNIIEKELISLNYMIKGVPFSFNKARVAGDGFDPQPVTAYYPFLGSIGDRPEHKLAITT